MDIDVFAGSVRGIAVSYCQLLLAGAAVGLWGCRGALVSRLVPTIGTLGYVLLVPETFLTKTCIVSSSDELVELMLLKLSARRIMFARVRVCRGEVKSRLRLW